MTFSRKILFLSALSLLLGVGCGGSGNPASEDGGLSSSESSSSSVVSSSSSLSAWCVIAGNCGTITDSRDSKTYRWTKIGDQVWMAENLDFGSYVVNSTTSPYTNQTDATTTNAEKYCLANNEANCTIYGGLYQWHTVMALPFSCNSTDTCAVDTHHRGICPEGWHVPTRAEWTALDSWVDTNNGGAIDDEGTSLKSTNLWSSGAGTDAYGWSGLPGGSRSYGSFYDYGYWWSASQIDAEFAWSRNLGNGSAGLGESDGNLSDYGFSLRCLQD